MATGPAQLAHHAPQQGDIVCAGFGPQQQLAQFCHAGPGGVGVEEAHLQQQGLGVGEGGLQGPLGGQGNGADCAAGARALALLLQGCQADGHRMGKVEGAVAGAGGNPQQTAGLVEFVVVEAVVFAAKYQGNVGGAHWRLQQPGQGFRWGQVGPFLLLPAARAGQHPPTVGQGIGQPFKAWGRRQLRAAPHRHQPGLGVVWIATGGHQPQLADLIVGAKPGDAAHVEGAGGLHQHQHHLCRHWRLCR